MTKKMSGRYYTSYGDYKDYTSDELLNDVYPGPIDGVFTPQPMDDRFTPQVEGMYSGNGRVTSARPKSRLRSAGRPPSRLDVGVQTEKRPKPAISETQYNYAIPDESMRPTSPVQRLLERWQTQPNMSLQGPPPGSQMDPITRQYYHRKWSTKVQPSNAELHLNRYGRAGGVWRHVRACVANTGTQLAFIDGTVKEEDNVFFPPWQTSAQPRRASFSAYNSQPNQITANFVPSTQKYLPPKSAKYRNRFHTHAKEGLKYWYQEPKPIDWRRKDFISMQEISKMLKTPLNIALVPEVGGWEYLENLFIPYLSNHTLSKRRHNPSSSKNSWERFRIRTYFGLESTPF